MGFERKTAPVPQGVQAPEHRNARHSTLSAGRSWGRRSEAAPSSRRCRPPLAAGTPRVLGGGGARRGRAMLCSRLGAGRGSRAAIALIYVKSLQLKRFVPRGASFRRYTLGKPGWAPPALAPTSNKSAARDESGPGAEAPPRHPAPRRHLRGAQAGAGLASGRRRAAGAGCLLPLSLRRRPLGAAGAARPGAPALRGLGLQQPKVCPGGGERLSTWWEFLSRVWGVFFTRNEGGETLPSFLAVSCSFEEEPRDTGSSGCLSAPDSLKHINRFI